MSRIIFSFTLVLAFAGGVKAQDDYQPSQASPFHTIKTHLYFLQSDHYEPFTAAQSLYPHAFTDSLERRRKAIMLKRVLDGKGLYVYLNRIPRKPNFVDSLTGQAIYTPFPKKAPGIYVEQVDSLWYYSQETVAEIEAMYDETFPFGAELFISLFPENSDAEFLGVAAWQWASIGILLVLAFILFHIIRWILRPIFKYILRKRAAAFELRPKLIPQLARIGSLFLVAWFIKIIIPSLLLSAKAAENFQKALQILLAVFAAMFFLKIVDIIITISYKLAERTESKMDDQILPIIKKVLNIIVIIWALFTILALLNVNVTALIAGISIGGLAIALAAQDTVKNFIGSLMIFSDKPFQIGDYIVGSDYEGTVREVGFRSTKIQHVDMSIISVPNGTIANNTVKNLGVRVYRAMNIKIGVEYRTPADRIEMYIAGLKELILSHPKCLKENFHVRFTDFNDSSLGIMFRAYIETDDYGEELGIKEELNLAIMRLAEALDIGFAFPSRSIYVENMPSTGQEENGELREEVDYRGRQEKFLEGYRARVSGSGPSAKNDME